MSWPTKRTVWHMFFAALTAEQFAALPAETRLSGLTARERLAGLSPAELAALRAELAEVLGDPTNPWRDAWLQARKLYERA